MRSPRNPSYSCICVFVYLCICVWGVQGSRAVSRQSIQAVVRVAMPWFTVTPRKLDRVNYAKSAIIMSQIQRQIQWQIQTQMPWLTVTPRKLDQVNNAKSATTNTCLSQVNTTLQCLLIFTLSRSSGIYHHKSPGSLRSEMTGWAQMTGGFN